AYFTTGRCMSDGVSVDGPIKTLIGDSLIVPDPQTLQIVLAQPAAYFLNILSYPVAYAVPQQTIARYGVDWTRHLTDASGLGGSLYMVTAWPRNGAITLTRNPNFWGAKPLLREIDYTFYPTADKAYTAWRNGKVDVGYAPTAQYATASTANDFHE